MGNKKYKVLSYDDRKTIEALYSAGVGAREIAERIGSTFVTIYRELKKGAPDENASHVSAYSAETAQERVNRNLHNRGWRNRTREGRQKNTTN